MSATYLNMMFGARAKRIVDLAAEWQDDRSTGSAKCSTYVDTALAEDDVPYPKLKADEAKWVNDNHAKAKRARR